MSIVNNLLDTRVSTVNVFSILSQVYGAKGIPFPGKPKQGNTSMIGGNNGTIKQYTDSVLGRYEFLPCTINDTPIPNAVVLITGEKLFVETDVIDAGTVFEKVFTRPYDITIIATLFGYDGQWPETEFKTMATLFKENDLVTLTCISTNIFLQPQDNFLLKKIDVLDSAGSENVEVIQFMGRSNIYFELELL